MNTTSAEEGQQPCSWIPKQKTHLKLVYICIQKRPTPDLSIGEDDFLYEWVVDKDIMMISEATAPPGDRWVEGTLTPDLEKMTLDVQSGSIFVAVGSCIYALGGIFPRLSLKWLETGGEIQTLLTQVYFCDVVCREEGWKRGPDLKHGRFKGTAAALNGRIYMFGGTSYFLDSEKQCSERPYTEVLDAASDSWISLSPAPPTLAYYKGLPAMVRCFWMAFSSSTGKRGVCLDMM